MGVCSIERFGPDYYDEVWERISVPYDVEGARIMARLCHGLTLDVGSGPCQYHDRLDDAVGVDFSRRALLRAKVGCLRVLGACESLPFCDGVFDSLLVHSVLEHLENPRLVLAECKRVLKARGRIVVSVPDGWPRRASSPSHRRAYNAKGLVAALAEHFSSVKLVVYKGRAKRLVAFGVKA